MANSKNELAYDKIKDLFNSGAIKPGDKFSAYELSKQLGISRTPITSALKRLEHEKLVEILPQIGCTLRYPNGQESREHFLIRAVLEGFAAEMATINATDQDINELNSILLRSEAAHVSKDEYASLNKAFHVKIVELSRMPHLIELINQFWETPGYYGISIGFVSGRQDISMQEHKEILEAIQKRDSMGVRVLVENHLRKCTDEFCANLNDYTGSIT